MSTSRHWGIRAMGTGSGRLKGEFWRPDERKVWMRKKIGWGWTINFAELTRRARAIR